MPIPTGRVVRLSEAAQKVFNDLNIEPGEYPPELATRLEQQVRLAAAENPGLFKEAIPDGVDPLRAPLPPMPLIDLKKLPAQHRQEIFEFVQQYRDNQARTAQVAALQIPEAGPGVNEAIAQAMTAAPAPAPTPTGRRFTVIDDLTEYPKVEALPQSPPVPPTPPAGDAGGAAPLTHCPHCNHDLTQIDPIEITDEDRVAFEAAIDSGDRVRQVVELLGGRLRVCFRDLIPTESDMAYRQTVIDAGNSITQKVVPDQEQLWGNLHSYRLAMGIEWIETSGQGKLEVPTLAELARELDPPEAPNTIVASYHNRVIREVLRSEQARVVIGDAFHIFQLKLKKMALQANDPKSWAAIAGSRS